MEKIIDVRETTKNSALLEADEAKETLQEIQTKNKVLSSDLDQKKSQLNAEIQGFTFIFIFIFITHN